MGVVGPRPKTESLKAIYNGQPYETYYRSVNKYVRPKEEWGIPSPYSMVDFKGTMFGPGAYGLPPTDVRNMYPCHLLSSPDSRLQNVITQALNRLYDKFKDVIYAEVSAELAAATATWQQAFDMIGGRATQLRKVFQAFRKGKWSQVKKLLSLSGKAARKPPSWRKRANDIGSAWLEFSYGWKPLVQDIYSAYRVLTGDTPPSSVKVTTAGFHYDVQRTYSDYTHTVKTIDAKLFFKSGCKVTVTNPSLFLAQQLGLVNPATVVWELIPFSFLVDWFVNVSDVLSCFTDFVGLAFLDPYLTRFYVASGGIAYTSEVYQFHQGHDAQAVWMSRSLETPPIPELSVAKLEGLSPARGLNALGLLLSSFNAAR